VYVGTLLARFESYGISYKTEQDENKRTENEKKRGKRATKTTESHLKRTNPTTNKKSKK
jgi:hypothetical protein